MSTYKSVGVHTPHGREPEVMAFTATGEDRVSVRFADALVDITSETSGVRVDMRMHEAPVTVYLSPEQARALAGRLLAATQQKARAA